MPIKNRYHKIALFSLYILLAVFITSCSAYKRPALGQDNTILVLADETIFDTHKPDLENIFLDPINTPMVENRFNIKRISIEEFKQGSAKYKNIILLANIDSETAEAQFIKKILSESILEGVRNGNYYYIVKEDLWSKGQNVLFLLDSKNLHLAGYLERFRDKLFNIFNERMMKNIQVKLFDNYNNKQAQEYAKKEFNIDIFVPHDFVLGEQGKDKDKFIRFRRTNPDRWLTLLRTDYNSELSFQENFISVRDRIGKQFSDSVKINPELLNFKQDSTFVPDGLKAEGIWEYFDGGEPFFTYAFIKNGSFYMIDGAVFAPSKEKYPYIIQLDLMAKTVKFLELEK